MHSRQKCKEVSGGHRGPPFFMVINKHVSNITNHVLQIL